MRFLTLQDFQKEQNPIAEDYSRSKVAGDEIYLTGHSHQAWPDCSAEGHMQAWNDAVEKKDEKWQRAFEVAGEVRNNFAEMMGDQNGVYHLGENTHVLLYQLLSCEKPPKTKIVTTDAEFHSARRQLQRLSEVGVEVEWVPAYPVEDLVDRLIHRVDGTTSTVLVSKVLYETGCVVRGLDRLAEHCRQHDVDCVVDAYHALNVIPFDLVQEGLESAYVLGGGYKYCQLGEGNCFLRRPPSCQKKPVMTGWFAEMESIDSAKKGFAVSFPEGPQRFAGSTYDVTSHYRARRVFQYFRERGLTPQLLANINAWQKEVLYDEFCAGSKSHIVFPWQLNDIGGFLAFQVEDPQKVCRELKRVRVLSDSRGSYVRFGPAPYLNEKQLRKSMQLFKEVVRKS